LVLAGADLSLFVGGHPHFLGGHGGWAVLCWCWCWLLFVVVVGGIVGGGVRWHCHVVVVVEVCSGWGWLNDGCCLPHCQWRCGPCVLCKKRRGGGSGWREFRLLTLTKPDCEDIVHKREERSWVGRA